MKLDSNQSALAPGLRYCSLSSFTTTTTGAGAFLIERMTTKYVILSVERREPNGYFVAIHGFTPFYSGLDQARRFDTEHEAKEYANTELFTTPDASVIQTCES